MARDGSRTPSPRRQDTRRSSPDVVDNPSDAQVEQDLGFFAGPSSPQPALINPAARQFYRQRRLSDTSTSSEAAFIDHRTQQHALSSAPRTRSTTVTRTPSRPLHKSFARGNSETSDGRSPASETPRRKLINVSPPRSPPGSPPARSREVDVDEEEGVIDHRPSLDRHDSHGSRRSGRSHRSPARTESLPPVFTPSLSRRPSDAERALEDVCFPHDHLRENELNEERAGPPLGHGGRGGLPGLLPNFPFPFDFGALEEHAAVDRDSVSPPARNEPLISFSPPKGDNLALPHHAQTMYEGAGGNGGLRSPAKRMRKLSESAGTGRGGRYQRKLALFEGFGSDNGVSAAAAASATPETQRRADVKTPLLGRTRSGRAVHADFGTHSNLPHFPTDGPARRASTSGAGAATSEKERPYRFSFYSNALPSTIHARSLSEIPAEGQTFEELFSGRKQSSEKQDWDEALSELGGLQSSTPTGANGTTTPQKSLGAAATRSGLRSDADAEDNTWWLDVLCPTDAEMRTFSKAFGIHPLTTEDIQMEESREKIELFRNYYLVCFRSFDQDPYSPTYLEPLNMYVIVFREGTLSFHYRGTPHPQNVRRRIKQLKDYISVSSDWISYALIDDITDAFGPLIQNIEYEVDSIDELVLILKETEQSDMLRRIGTCRKKVMGLLRLMGNKADVVKGLAKRCNENWSVAPKSDIGLYLSDIQDHLLTMTANLNHYEKILSRSHSNYLAQISIEMTEANNAINDVLSRLTALGTVLVPLNLVTGLFGMNVKVPGQEVDSLTWFWSILGALLAFAIGGGYATYKLMGHR